MFKKIKNFFSSRRTGGSQLRIAAEILLASAFMVVYSLLDSYTDVSRRYLLLAVIAGYIVVVAAVYLIRRALSSSTAVPEVKDAMLGNLTLDFMVRLSLPVVICDDSGRIAWYNKALTKALSSGGAPKENLHGQNISRICGIGLQTLISDTSDSGIETAAFDGFYRLKAYRFESAVKGRFLNIILWNDVTENAYMVNRLADENTIIAYIVIDNIEEIMQFVQDRYHDASADVAAILKDWAKKSDGIIKEYERDKFIFIFSAKQLGAFTVNKFDVLDKIREVRVGEGNLSLTVSIGISSVDGTLFEKERASHAALDMALQRGGDQVVLKTEAGLEFYGGRSKSVQKRTKVRARVVANELILLISRSSNVLVMCHRYADFDAIGACSGIARLAMFCGTKVNIIANKNDPNLKKCFEKLGKLEEYCDVFIDSSAAQDLITSDTLLVIVDVNNRTQFESTDIADNVHTVAFIDHHRKTAEFQNAPAMTYIEPSASSSCELISEILEQTLPQNYLTQDEAEIMLAGILLDTKQFSRMTGIRTFSAALYLRGEGADTANAQALFNTGLDDFRREANFESNVVIYRGIIAIARNDSEDTASADRIAAAKAADKLLSIDGVTASFAICKIDGVIHISARSVGIVNVQLVLERLGGGGHFDAAATQIKNSTMTEAQMNLKAAIDAYMDEAAK